jgi:hypothetical protein
LCSVVHQARIRWSRSARVPQPPALEWGGESAPPIESGTARKSEERLRNPAPGSRIEAAQKYGISLSLLIEQLRLTPAEGARKIERASIALEEVRDAARKLR